jgi:outer membrane protein assembly factor BamB
MMFSRTIGIGVLAITAGSAAYGQDILRHYSIPGNADAALPFFWAQSATPDGSGGMFFFDFSKASLHRFDSAGKELWSAPLSFGSSQGVVASMAVASDGVYLAGQVNGALPGQTSVGSYDAFAVKYDLNGKVLWTRQFGTPDDDFVRDIIRAPDGTYTVGGTAAGASRTFFIRRSDADGNEIWTRRFDPGNLVDIIGAAADSTGIYFVGMTTQTNYNALRKFDSDGNDLWTYQLDRFSIIVGIAPDEHGVYILFYPDGGHPVDIVRRLDLTGSEIWTRQIVTSYVSGSIAADATGFYLSGGTYSALPDQCYAGQGDAFLMRFDAGGNPIWTREFGTAIGERPASISIGAAGVDVTSFDYSNGVFLTTIAKTSPPVTDPRPKILWECVLNAASYLGGGVAPARSSRSWDQGWGPPVLRGFSSARMDTFQRLLPEQEFSSMGRPRHSSMSPTSKAARLFPSISPAKPA